MSDKLKGPVRYDPKTGKPLDQDATVNETEFAKAEFATRQAARPSLGSVATAQKAKAKAPEPEALPTIGADESFDDFQKRLEEHKKRKAKAAVQADALEGRTKPSPSPSPSPK